MEDLKCSCVIYEKTHSQDITPERVEGKWGRGRVAKWLELPHVVQMRTVVWSLVGLSLPPLPTCIARALLAASHMGERVR